MKWKGSELIGWWADCMTLPVYHTQDLGFGVSSSEFQIALSQEWNGRLTWKEKDVSHPLMTMILTSVPMLVWSDVPDSDVFRRWRGVDISSFWLYKISKFVFSVVNIMWYHEYRSSAISHSTLEKCIWYLSFSSLVGWYFCNNNVYNSSY